MKKLTNSIMAASLVLLGFLTTGFIMPPNQETVVWRRCCQDQPKGARCSDAKTKAACYRACQNGCGDADGLPGKMCRLDCDRNMIRYIEEAIK